MTNGQSDHEKITIDVTPAEAEMIVEGLRMLLNTRRYSFKAKDDDVRKLHGPLFDAVERFERLLAPSASVGQKS